ncbi:hypothetical protein KAI87_10850 [Myxococcota bacterium]|nr:hypothetical protein [Myxococcota bacterium]
MAMLGGASDTQLTTVPFNPTGCDSLEWEFWGREGLNVPESTDYLYLEYSLDNVK